MLDSRRACCNSLRASQPGARSLQGFSVAEWEPIGGGMAGRGGRAGGPPTPVALKVVTTNLVEGWLRRNGVAYSDATTLTEYWDRVAFPNGDVWLTVSQYVSDPKYLTAEYHDEHALQAGIRRIEMEAGAVSADVRGEDRATY